MIVVNAFFLYNYLGGGEKERLPVDSKPPGAFLVKELGFDDAQKEEFRALTRAHRRTMRGISDDIRGLKDVLFKGLSDASFEDTNIDSIASLIGEKEKLKDLEVYRHFKSVQELCNDKQKEKFSKIINDALHKGPGNQRGPRGDGPNGNRPPRPDGPRGDRPHGDGPPPKRP
ncbi:hypothetical protein DIS18_01125 [Algibacter marinivivus]|uniref:LTXXQ motif family protein n=1 Tax=Algibacter marinivivus TaxID=2100723 RepID=A0A2U2X604_9FLAO|nr:hypothetical protein DIS18_01125 [Algibacter marinivivus]